MHFISGISSKIFLFIVAAATAVATFSCSGLQKTGKANVRYQADTLFAGGNYAQALEMYRSLTAGGTLADSAMLRNMSVAAHAVGDYAAACDYGHRYSSTGDTLKLTALCASLDSVGRHSSADRLYDENRQLLSSVYGHQVVTNRLAVYYNDTQNEKLKDIYPEIQAADVRSACFANYFKMVADSLSADEKTKLCKAALADNPKQAAALNYIAVSLYESAEAKYKTSMADYNKKKNATTYAYLRRDLKRISKIYSESKTYFEKLRKIEPENKNHIKYLININLRLNQPEKAQALEKLL